MKVCLVTFISCAVLSCLVSAASGRASDACSEQAARLLRRVRLPAARRALVPRVLSDVQDTLQELYPGCEVQLFGSIAAGVGIAMSDVDVSVRLRARDPATNASASALVVAAQDAVRRRPDLFQILKVVPSARVPLLTVKHLPSDFKVDISFSNYNGVQNSRLVRHLVTLDERARDLARLLKYWGRRRGLTGPTMMPSYGVVSMAVFFLQRRNVLPPVAFLQAGAEPRLVNDWNMGFVKRDYRNDNNESLCELLGGFFEFYSEFDFDSYAACPYVGRAVELARLADWRAAPAEFQLYRANVASGVARPLAARAPVLQDVFEHNSNLMARVTAPEKRALLRAAVQAAADHYRNGSAGLLKAIFV